MVVHASILMVAKLKQETNKSSLTDLHQRLNLQFKSVFKWSSGNTACMPEPFLKKKKKTYPAKAV